MQSVRHAACGSLHVGPATVIILGSPRLPYVNYVEGMGANAAADAAERHAAWQMGMVWVRRRARFRRVSYTS